MEHLAKAYADQGYYVHGTPLLDDNEVAAAVAGMDAVRDGAYDTGRPPEPSPWQPGMDQRQLCKVEMPQLANHALMHAVSSPRLGEVAAAITGAEMVQVWWVQLLIKPPADPSGAIQSNVGWHQDAQYWGIWEEGSELFTAWLALSDVREDCGPMHFVEGSHRWGFLDQGNFFDQNLEDQRAGLKLPPGAEWRETAAVLPPGGASFHHCLTVHGSGPNRSSGLRRSLAIHLRTEKSRAKGSRADSLAKYIDNTNYCPVIWGEIK